MKQELPRFAEIADMRCQEASQGTKTINIKVAINTARMMVEAEIAEHKNYRLMVAMLRDIRKEMVGKNFLIGPIDRLLNQIGE